MWNGHELKKKKNVKQTGLTKIPRCKYTFFPNSPPTHGATDARFLPKIKREIELSIG